MSEIAQVVDVLNQSNRRALRKMGMDTRNFCIEQLINPTEIRNGLIRTRFLALRSSGKTYLQSVQTIADQEKCSDDQVKKIVSSVLV